MTAANPDRFHRRVYFASCGVAGVPVSFANAVVVVLGVVLLGLGAAVAGMTLALSKGDDYPGRIP